MLQFLHQNNVQFVCLAAGRPTQAGDATDQWRHRWKWNAPTVCLTQWRSPASAGWLSWIVDVDRPSVVGQPKQRNRLDSSPGCLGATCEARWTWRSHAASTSVCSWLCVTARPCHLSGLRVFTALHEIQTGSSDENSVRLSVRQTRGLWQKERMCPDFFIPYDRSFSLVFWEKEWLVWATSSTLNLGSTGPRWGEIADFEQIIARKFLSRNA